MDCDGTVLVIDDSAGFRGLVRALLKDEGFEIVEVQDSTQAVEAALRARPDAILLDWRMPGESGIDACRHLRDEPQLADVPIVMLTALSDARDRELARHAGADAFIVKDTASRMLAPQLRRLLDARPALH